MFGLKGEKLHTRGRHSIDYPEHPGGGTSDTSDKVLYSNRTDGSLFAAKLGSRRRTVPHNWQVQRMPKHCMHVVREGQG